MEGCAVRLNEAVTRTGGPDWVRQRPELNRPFLVKET